jgi:hypothetical protein
MDLALEFGMPVGELSQRMSAAEEVFWIARHAVEPLPTQQIVMHLAQISMWIQNVNAAKNDRGKLTDFMLFFEKKPTQQGDSNATLRSNFDTYIERQKRK